MKGPYVVGVDCGTQSAKVVIFDAHGIVVARGDHPLQPMLRPLHGVVVHPADDLWTATATASRKAIAAFVGDPAEIVAIGLCPIRCCKAFLDADGRLIEPLVSWMDERAYRPYVPTDPAFAFATTSSGYLAHRFTGEFRDTAANNIEMQWPIDTDTWEWSDDPTRYAVAGVARDKLFALQMPGEIIGLLTADAALATGFPQGLPVVATANDKAVEMLAAGAIGPATALVSLGTYIAAMVPGSTNHTTPTNFWTNFSAVPRQYLYESNGVRRGMWTLTWFLDLLGPELANRTAELGVTREEYLEREAVLVPAGSDGLMTVLDWLAPSHRATRKGSMLGFDARHTRGHLYRSILEAIALTMKTNVDAMCVDLGITIERLVVSGGGASSPLFLQIFSDVFGIPAARSIGAAGASLGAAMCAAAAVGLHADIPTAAMAMASPRETFTPNTADHEVYRRMNDTVYRDIRSATDSLYERAYPIFH